MESEKRVEFLKEQLDRTNYWLSFAEAKNAALIAVNIAIAAVVINMIDGFPVISALTIIILTVSSTICIWSFMPNENTASKNEDTVPLAEEEKEKNLLFWGDIASISSSRRYSRLLAENYFLAAEEDLAISSLEQDYIDEIYINSQIAHNKYVLFKKALYIDIISCVMCILLFAIVA